MAEVSVFRTWRRDWRSNHDISLLQQINCSLGKWNISINTCTPACVKLSYKHILTYSRRIHIGTFTRAHAKSPCRHTTVYCPTKFINANITTIPSVHKSAHLARRDMICHNNIAFPMQTCYCKSMFAKSTDPRVINLFNTCPALLYTCPVLPIYHPENSIQLAPWKSPGWDKTRKSPVRIVRNINIIVIKGLIPVLRELMPENNKI